MTSEVALFDGRLPSMRNSKIQNLLDMVDTGHKTRRRLQFVNPRIVSIGDFISANSDRLQSKLATSRENKRELKGVDEVDRLVIDDMLELLQILGRTSWIGPTEMHSAVLFTYLCHFRKNIDVA